MRRIRRLVERLIANWLNSVVELGETGRSRATAFDPHMVSVEYRVLTPSLERLLEESA